MGRNVRQIILPFHTNASAIADGGELNVGAGHVLMNVAVTGDAVDFILVIEGKANDNDDYTGIMCPNLETFAMSTTITANGKYQLSLEAITRLRIRLLSISSGAVSVIGTVVN